MKWHCPICGRATDSAAHPEFPFCSPRCQLIDLGHWASERYRVREPASDASELHDDHESES